MGKGNEDLKAKIAKIQNKGKTQPSMPAPDLEEEQPEPSMEDLEAEFEQKKKALEAKARTVKPAEEPIQDEAGIEKAIAEYSDDGKFRVELIFQLVQLNNSLKEIARALKGDQSNGD